MRVSLASRTVSLSRRGLLAGAAALAPGAARAAPAGLTAKGWIDYEARLEARRADAGGGRFDAAAGQSLLELTNRARRGAAAGALAWHEDLAETARAHAADLAERTFVEHLSPEGFDPSDRLALVSRRWLGSTSENIAYERASKPATAQALMTLWRGSPKHWTNLTSPRHTHAGFGVARKGERTYAVGLYAKPAGELAAPLPFRLSAQAELERALAGVVERFSLKALGAGADHDVRAVLAGGGRTPPGVYQLFVQRPVDARTYAVLPGPVFAWRVEDVG